MSDRDMATNFVIVDPRARPNSSLIFDPRARPNSSIIVDPRARPNSSLDIEGYSLLPDIIWTPGPDMLNSQYGRVIFNNVRDSYPTNEDLLCSYTLMNGVDIKEDDRVAIFCVGWAHVNEVITWVFAAKHPWPNEDLSVVFPACHLPAASSHFYQFCYLSAGEVRGASIPFNFVNKANGIAENQKILYLQNHSLVGTPAQINIVSTGGDTVLTVASDNPQNLSISSAARANDVIHPGPATDERSDTEDSDASSCEVTSSEQYSQNKKLKTMSGAPMKTMYKRVAPTSQGVNCTEITVPPCVCIPSSSRDQFTVQTFGPQSPHINNIPQQNFPTECERQNYELMAMAEETDRLRARLSCEEDRIQFLSENLYRCEAEVERQNHQYALYRQNNAVVIAEYQNELENQRMRIRELNDIISRKERIIAFFIRKYGPIDENDENAIAFGASPQFLPNPGPTDGQLQQEGHVRIGARISVQKRNRRRSTDPFYAALQKTRNYYSTFLSDKAEVERRVFALSCTKLSLVKKLQNMQEKKESLKRVEYQHYTALQNMRREQNGESRRILVSISEITAQVRNLDAAAFMEVDMIDEINKRLDINKENIITLRLKAIEVFSEFIESYNSSMVRHSAEAQTEKEHIHALYAGLDKRFEELLHSIATCYYNTYIWQ